MKKIIIILILIIPMISVSGQEIEPAPADKAVVYFIRASSLGALINFSYFDKDKLIGRFNGPKYIRYECDPGVHLFWARSENKDFVEANIEAGKIYVIEAVPKMGGIKASVRLMPLKPGGDRKMKRILKLLLKRTSENFTPDELKQTQEELSKVISRGLKKYEKLKTKGRNIKVLNPEMNFEPAALKLDDQ